MIDGLINITVPLLPMFESSTWHVTKDGNLTALALFQRHYSKRRYKDGRKPTLFVGPGEKLVLVTTDGQALFVWRKFISRSGENGINCAVFRNEGSHLSSTLILEAEKYAIARWGLQRLYTYVNTKKIKSTNPGYCFKKADWKVCGVTKVNKLLVLEKVSNEQTVQVSDTTKLNSSNAAK